MAKFGFGDIVKIRNEEELGRVVCEIQDEDGSIWYEVEPVGFKSSFNREIKETDLSMA